MKVRELPGAFALGLLASVLGHTAAYGNEHTMGGPHHGLLTALVAAAVGGFVLAGLALAWAGADGAADGSVLATRLTRYLPGVLPLAAAATAWYCLFESIEGSHAEGSLLLIALAIAGATLVVHRIARAAIAAIAAFVLSVFRNTFAQRGRRPRVLRDRPLRAYTDPAQRRLFARPPPA